MRWARLGLATAVVVALAGCSPLHPFGGDDDERVAKATPAAPKPLARAWARRSASFTNVQNIGEVAVMMRSSRRRLYVDALDPATGKRLWTHEATTSLLGRDWLRPLAVGGKVAYLRPAGVRNRLEARLVIVEPRTGRPLARTPVGAFSSTRLSACPDDAAAICTRFSSDSRPLRKSYRFSLAAPKLKREPVATKGPLASAYPVADGTLVGGDGQGGWIGRASGRKLLWRHRTSTLFGKGRSLLAGGSIDHHPAAGVYAGTVWPTSSTGKSTYRLSTLSMAGFDDDGTPLWRAPRVSSNCLGTTRIPAPGLPSGRFVADLVPLRCRYTGTLNTANPNRYVGKKLRVTLQRYDLKTGKTVWSTPIGSAPVQTLRLRTAHHYFANPSIVDDTHLAVSTGRRTLVIDLATGKSAPVTAATPIWCQPDAVIRYRQPIYHGSTVPQYQVYGGFLAQPCDTHAKARRFAVYSVPAMVSAHFAAGVSVYATPKGVYAYRTGATAGSTAG